MTSKNIAVHSTILAFGYWYEYHIIKSLGEKMCVKNVSRERISYVRTREIYVRMISNPRRCSPNKLMILFPQIYLCLMMMMMMMIHDHDHDSMISYSNTITPCFQMFKNFRNLKREMRTILTESSRHGRHVDQVYTHIYI